MECNHKKCDPYYEYVQCRDCGSIKTDGDSSWGIAKNMWFSSYEVACFYKKNGFIPQPPQQ